MRIETLVLDANLLVLYIVGVFSRAYIREHKRLVDYTEEDFDLLVGMVNSAENVVVTPHVLAEASNLAAQTKNPKAKRGIRTKLGEIISAVEETYAPSKKAASHNEFVRLGITDAALLDLSMGGIVVCTTDVHLFLAMSKAGTPAINFHHYREANWSA